MATRTANHLPMPQLAGQGITAAHVERPTLSLGEQLAIERGANRALAEERELLVLENARLLQASAGRPAVALPDHVELRADRDGDRGHVEVWVWDEREEFVYRFHLGVDEADALAVRARELCAGGRP